MQIKCLSNGSYSLKNCHNPFGKAFQPTPPYGKIPVEHLKSLHGSSLTWPIFFNERWRLREACLHQNGWISGKFPNGLWTPPPLFQKIILRFFPQTGCAGTKFAMKFFRSEMTSPPFLKFFWKFMTKKAVSNAKKLQWNFLDRKWPPPPFGNFPEIHPFWRRQASLSPE